MVEELNEAFYQRTGLTPESQPDLCYFLGDNPSYSKTWSAASGRIPTFRRNAASGKFWFPHVKRWLTNSEKSLSTKDVKLLR